MADDILIDGGDGTDYTVSADDASGALVQRVKLAYSADGVATHVVADVDGLLVNLGANNDVTVSGVATAAHQVTQNGYLDGVETKLDTIDGHVDGIEGLITSSNVNTAAIAASVAGTLDTELPAAAALSDTLGNPTSPMVGSSGLVWSGSVWRRAREVVAAQDTAGSGIQATGPLFQFDDSSTASVTENQFAPPRISSRRAVLVEGVASGTAIPISDNSGSLTVDGTLAVTQSGTWDEVGINDSGNSITVDDGAGSLTVDGTVAVSALAGTVAVTQSGTWDEIGINDSGNSITVDNTDVTAAATSLAIIDDWDESDRAKINPIVGQAGIAAGTGTDGATVPRVTLATNVALPAGANAIGKLAANSGVDIGDVDVTSVPTDPFGANADAASATGSIAAKLRFIAATGIPVTGTVTVGSHAVTNAGTFAAQIDGNALTSLQLIDDPVFADDAAFTPATSKVMMAGFQADESSTDSVDEGDAGAARMTLDRKVIVTSEPHTAGGLTTAMFSGSDGSSILTNASQVIKASAGQIYGYYIYNPNAAATFVHFYNTAAASVTVGTTNPLFSLTIPAAAAANLMGTMGIAFSNAGFSIAATTTAGGNSAPSTGLDAVVWYA